MPRVSLAPIRQCRSQQPEPHGTYLAIAAEGCRQERQQPKVTDMKASDLLVRALENEGVEYIFGLPGEENLDLLESLRESKIRLVLTRHEQGAGFMAATYGRLTGKPGVCMATLGPGATNLLTPTAFAFLGGMPLLVITGQKPIKSSKQGRFQILDIVRMMEPVTKLSRQIVDGNNIPHLVREGFRTATSEKPGPVHLELPEDVAAENVDRSPFAVTTVDPPASSQRDLRNAADLLMAAKRPLVLFASGANRQSTSQAATHFIEKTGLYFCNTQMGKGVVDERHERFLGTAALSSGDYLHCAIERSDLILNVGHDVVEKPPFRMEEEGGRTVIHLSFFAAQMDDLYFPQHEVLGCMATNLKQLAQMVTKSDEWDVDYFARVKMRLAEDVYGADGDPTASFPNAPSRIVHDVRAAMPSDGILSLDNGMYKIWFARNYLAHGPNTILLDNALATMGAGLPAAMAAKLVRPDRDVLAIVGDGGFMMNSQELETAVRLKQDLVVLVLRDNAYGMIRWKQASDSFPDYGLEFGNPDFVAYANSYGANGARVTETGQLPSLIQRGFERGGVHVIEVPVDYSENERVLLDELAKRTCTI